MDAEVIYHSETKTTRHESSMIPSARPTALFSRKVCFVLRYFKSVDGRTETCVKIMITTGRVGRVDQHFPLYPYYTWNMKRVYAL